MHFAAFVHVNLQLNLFSILKRDGDPGWAIVNDLILQISIALEYFFVNFVCHLAWSAPFLTSLLALSQACVQNLGVSLYFQTFFYISLISSFSNFLTSSRLVRFFRLTAPAAMLGHLGAISLKNLTKRKEVRKLRKELIRLIILITYTNKFKMQGNVISFFCCQIPFANS